MLRFHGSRDKQTFELVGTNSRLDAVQAAMLRVFLPHLAGWNAARREAAARYAELGLGERSSCPSTSRATCTTCTSYGREERDRIAAALREREIACAAYYVTPLHLQPAMALPRLRGRLAARDGARRRREPRPADVGRHRRRPAGRGRRRRAGRRRRRRLAMRSPVNRHSHLAGRCRRGDRRRRLVACLEPALRPGPSRLLRPVPRLVDRPPRRRGEAARLRALGLLQPLVAVRLDARHVGRAPRRRARVDRGVPRLHALQHPPRRRAARCVVRRPAPLPRLRRRGAPSRPDADRAAPTGADRHARQGRDRRRRGRRRAARREGDAAQPRPRLLADRARRRRQPQAKPSPARRPRPRHGRRPRPDRARPPAGRGVDRDPERVGPAPRANRRDDSDRRRAGQDAAGDRRARLGRRRPRARSSVRSRSRTFSGASRSRSTSLRSRAT